ncbi:MAG: twin-arginine translocase subunit TatC [Chloroflexota bacterium]|nr:twin-arginine translocase subunit TatC [Chloroflexota bacterium]
MATKLSPPRKVSPPPQPEAAIIEDDDGSPRMTLWDHLDELRKRITWAAISLLIGTIIGVAVAAPVLLELQKPYGREFQVIGPTDSVVAYFRVSLLVGGILAIPMITYQVLVFILPGLTRKEKRYVLTALPAITLLFLVGAAFAWYILVPPAMGFLENFQATIFEPDWTAEAYLGFVTALIFWMGVAFQTPLIFFITALLGFVTAGGLLKQWRIAIVSSAIAAALITPTIDPVNMALVMGPLLVLYLFSIILVAIGRRFSGVSERATAT